MSFGGRIFAKKVTVDGIVFDSQMEADYYGLLKDRESKGEISNLSLHPAFELQPGYTRNDGTKVAPLNYEADFSFDDRCAQKGASHRVVDVKGFMTDDFVIKWKIFDYIYGRKAPYTNLEVFKYSKSTGWVPYAQYKEARKSYKKALIAEKNAYKKRLERMQWLKERIDDPSQKPAMVTRYRKEFEALISEGADKNGKK